MSTITTPVQTLSDKPAATPSKAARKDKNAPLQCAPEQMALPKKMPDYIHAQKQMRIIANVDVGWGNAVYLRGDGGGLSWDVGVPMTCLMNDLWVWSCPENNAPQEIKFLRNDLDWDLGENHRVRAEDVIEFTPHFP